MPEWDVGDFVTLRADPSIRGVVVRVIGGGPEHRYEVFCDGRTATYYASQLREARRDEETGALVAMPEFRARLSALQIRHPSLSFLYSLHAARIEFVPYQFRPVLKLLQADRPRLLIADEVGVGKTIEAGLILAELQARRRVRSVLVLCPKPLVTERKWLREMHRFDEQFVQLDGPRLRDCVSATDEDGFWPERYARSIVPFSLFDERLLYGKERPRQNRTAGLLALDPPPRFDLIIVDEAQHLRNPDTYLHQGVRFLCRHAEAVVFLSATPVQIQSDDLFVLLHLLRPDLFPDRKTYEYVSGPNPFISAAVSSARAAKAGWEGAAREDVVRAAETPWGRAALRDNPRYLQLRERLAQGVATPHERLELIRDLEGLHSLSNLINRTRRRDIGHFTTRQAETVEVPFTPRQRRVHDALLAAQARVLRRRHGDRQIAFMLTTLRRQAASCLHGLAPLIRGVLSRALSELEWDEADDLYEPIDREAVELLAGEIRDVLQQAERLEGEDPKLDALRRVIREKQKLPNNKVLLFSGFRQTLAYLREQIGRGEARVGLMHGGTGDEARRLIRDRFSLPPEDPSAIDVLLSSEVGCEGLDYQFCDCLVNYDLPWNPMRVEQRIGRIDRYGQRSPTVVIYNFVTPGTVDAEIYARCHLRIGVFRQALGGSEEILGRLTRQLRAVVEDPELGAEERAERLGDLTENEMRVIEEQAASEERDAPFFGVLAARQQFEQEVREASSAWLAPAALRDLIHQYLVRRVGAGYQILGEGAIQSLGLGHDARRIILEDYRRLSGRPSPAWRKWERWLKGARACLEITFDAATGADHRDVAFINLLHPLTQQAVADLGEGRGFYTVARVRDTEAPPGEYPFALYLWRQTGLPKDAQLVPVCASACIEDRLLSLLERAEVVPDDILSRPSTELLDELEQTHYHKWRQARDAHRERIARIAASRGESREASHAVRPTPSFERGDAARARKAGRSRESPMAVPEADRTRRRVEMSPAEEQADILTEAVAFGVLIVES